MGRMIKGFQPLPAVYELLSCSFAMGTILVVEDYDDVRGMLKVLLESEEFLNQTPYNRAFAETMTFVKDFWNIPEFGQLLEPTQRYLSGYVVAGQFDDAQTALDGLAEEQDAVLVEAGYLE